MNPLLDAIDSNTRSAIKELIANASREGRVLDYGFVDSLSVNPALRGGLANFYNSFHCTGLKPDGTPNLNSTVVPAIITEYIQTEYHYVIIDGLFYVYENGYYKRDTKDNAKMGVYIDNLIKPEYRSKNRKAEVLEQLRRPDHIRTPEQMNTHDKHYICFKNGVYDPIEKKLLPHSPEYGFLNQIPFDYVPEDRPKGDAIESFFKSIRLSNANYVMLLSFIGYCLTTDTRLQKFLVLKGRPGTGKSQLLNLIKYIVGSENCSSESLEELNGNRFRAYNVLGKICNINADLTTEGTVDPAIIKQLVGEDTLSVERKGSQAITITPYAKYLFAMNNFPVIKARDESFYRRVMILPVDTVPAQIDERLQEKLRAESDYLIHEAVKALELYYQYDEKAKIESQESKDLAKLWQQKGDSVAAFFAEEDPFSGQRYADRAELYKLYKDYCIDEGRQPLGRGGFNDSLRAKGIPEKKHNGVWTWENTWSEHSSKEQDFEQITEKPPFD